MSENTTCLIKEQSHIERRWTWWTHTRFNACHLAWNVWCWLARGRQRRLVVMISRRCIQRPYNYQ